MNDDMMPVKKKMTREELRAFRIANLSKHWNKPGEIRNPRGKGIPKKIWDFVAKLPAPNDAVEVMLRNIKVPRKNLSFEEGILIRLAYEAAKGDMKAIELWVERRFGKVPQNMDLNLPSGPLVAILNAPQGDQHVSVTTPAPPTLPTP